MATNLFCVRTDGFYVCKESLYEGLGLWRKFPFSAIDVRPNFALRLRAHGQASRKRRRNQVRTERHKRRQALFTPRALGVR